MIFCSYKRLWVLQLAQATKYQIARLFIRGEKWMNEFALLSSLYPLLAKRKKVSACCNRFCPIRRKRLDAVQPLLHVRGFQQTEQPSSIDICVEQYTVFCKKIFQKIREYPFSKNVNLSSLPMKAFFGNVVANR
jgi:hypothetical protein